LLAEQKYPFWLNAFAGVSLVMFFGGMVFMTIGFDDAPLIAGLGAILVWISARITGKIRRSNQIND